MRKINNLKELREEQSRIAQLLSYAEKDIYHQINLVTKTFTVNAFFIFLSSLLSRFFSAKSKPASFFTNYIIKKFGSFFNKFNF